MGLDDYEVVLFRNQPSGSGAEMPSIPRLPRPTGADPLEPQSSTVPFLAQRLHQ